MGCLFLLIVGFVLLLVLCCFMLLVIVVCFGFCCFLTFSLLGVMHGILCFGCFAGAFDL